jgi:hypothetical protein
MDPFAALGGVLGRLLGFGLELVAGRPNPRVRFEVESHATSVSFGDSGFAVMSNLLCFFFITPAATGSR